MICCCAYIRAFDWKKARGIATWIRMIDQFYLIHNFRCSEKNHALLVAQCPKLYLAISRLKQKLFTIASFNPQLRAGAIHRLAVDSVAEKDQCIKWVLQYDLKFSVAKEGMSWRARHSRKLLSYLAQLSWGQHAFKLTRVHVDVLHRQFGRQFKRSRIITEAARWGYDLQH